MAKREKKKRRWIFPLILVIYAVIFLGAAAWGLDWFWDYMDAYERSRPHIALDAYTEKLTPEYVCDASKTLIDSIDHHVQSEESCRSVILDYLAKGLTVVKKSRESTEDKHVYAVLCDKKVIGTMEMERKGEVLHDFTTWVVTKDSFDLSFLVTEPVSVTVPHNFSVFINGNLLDGSYITADQIHYEQLEHYYETYPLPYMVTYQAGPFLGTSERKITDPSGQEVAMEVLEDLSRYISNCSEAEVSDLDTISDAFIHSYVAFTSRTGGDNMRNYHALAEYMLPNGELSKRMYAALDGLYWISDRGATLSELNIHHYVSLGEGRYLCDLTYVVNTKNFTGDIQTTSNLQVIFLKTENGLKAESMLSY